MQELTYRKALDSDIDYLLWLRESTMTEHLRRADITAGQEEHLQRIHYRFEAAKIILLNGQPIGLLKIQESANEIEIIQIQIDPQYQGKGFGAEIIRSVLDQSQNKTVSLSVLKENKARKLYERLGFKITREDDLSYIMSFRN